MGNDGGSIPTRRELVKEAAKALSTTQLKEARTEQQAYAWTHDPITRKPLAQPVVSDSSGTLYNKETIIEYLLQEEGDTKKVEAERFLQGRVKSLKDVVEVKFQVVDGKEEIGGGSGRTEKWVCPITGRELGPGSKAVYLVPCGHAFAGSVVKEVSGEVCLQCNTAYASNDIIPILPVEPTDIAHLTLRVQTLKEKGLTHALKKAPGSKKRKKHAEKETANGESTSTPTEPTNDSSTNGVSKDKPSSTSTPSTSSTPKPDQQRNTPDPSSSTTTTNLSNIKNASTASLTRKVLQEQEERNKRRKLQQNDNVKSLFSSRSATPSQGNSRDYMTRGFSIGNAGGNK
ncbi:DUF602-domain-containing protein [Westerdykella ornata]|uniref:DUF602-domain-containing protein n=1 Tax=Westerdykella ornata TaxID=318751 RepID=A0A6A6JV26_WESOR|nr:DUF602-domain-containing protein [Westerdykella ornata]KAF2280095.1 DUF602-domain-containing protein [Westerdykella ornata]